jgi:mannose-6-phosphate isomerase-like protein (cupin superfamily)
MLEAAISAVNHLACLVATENDGVPVLRDMQPRLQPARSVVETAWFWMTGGVPDLAGSVGGPPERSGLSRPGEAKFGVVRFPAHSEGEMPVETDFHRTNSVDFEVVISGRIVLEFVDGQARLLGAGSSVVMCGVPHRWRNPFGEPCVYAAVVLGAHPAPEPA